MKEDNQSHKTLEDACRNILLAVNEDPNREGLLDTPKRFAKAIHEMTHGYNEDIEQIVGNAIFKEDFSEMVVVRNIEFYSLCEHHILPFFGHAHIAYIPNGRIIGLSKIPRIVRFFARRLQVQERLTAQIAHALQEILAPNGVACAIEARHMCMMMRGIQVQSGSMVTHSMLGDFLNDAKTRSEFMSVIRGSQSHGA